MVIEFRGWSAQLVRERRWHASQKLTELPRGRLRFEVQVAHMDDVWPWVLSWGGEARVVAPRELRRIVSDQAAAIATTYRKKKKGG